MSDTATVSAATTIPLPKDRLAGLKENWRQDLTSGFILFLIALPLSLAIAQASGAPPIAGIIAAVVGSLIVSQVGGSHLVINGPAAGLITVIAASVDRLGGGPEGFHYALGAIVCAGAILLILGLLKAGELGYFFPSSVIHGMLAAIGLTIIIKQFPLMLGAKAPAKEALILAFRTPEVIMGANPEIALIGTLSLALLLVHAAIKVKWIKSIPAPIAVVAFAMVLGVIFHLDQKHNYDFAGHLFAIEPNKVLVVIPNNPLDGLAAPDWGKIGTVAFWFSAVSIAMVQGIESLLTAAAVSEKLDPWRRSVNLSRDIGSIGGATIVSGSIGGIPMIAEIVRSQANVMVGAKTRWSNFFHGCFLLGFVLMAAQLIDRIPIAALAALLIVTGYRLASPSVFKKTHAIGGEQTIVFCVTIIMTLAIDLLVGVAAGIVTKFLLHLYHGAPIASLFKADVDVDKRSEDNYVVNVKGSAVFSNYIPLKKKLDTLPKGVTLTVDLSGCKLVDHTVMDRLSGYAQEYQKSGGKFLVIGLDEHKPGSGHPLAMRRLIAGRT